MKALLKALGVTIWGTIAFALLTTFVLVGYRAGMRYRDSSSRAVETAVPHGQPAGNDSVGRSSGDSVGNRGQPSRGKVPAASSTTMDAARKQLRDAADQHQYYATLAY